MTLRIPMSWAILAPLAGCVINGDRYIRPGELEESWLVNRTRILGIRARPAEIAPGERAELEALLATAADEDPDLLRLWLACPDGDEGCATDALGDLDLENPDPEALEAIGFVGFELGIPGETPPSWVAPEDLLDGLGERERLEGRNVTVQLTAFPADQLEASGDIDFNEVEAGFKRLVVSEARTPNNNPELAAFTVDGLPIPDAADVVTVEPSQGYTLGLLLAEQGGIEEYEFVNSEGEVEQRVEEPYASWYTTRGEMLEPLTLWPFFEADWVAPPDAGTTGTWFVVVRDRRGGMSWHVQDWAVGTP